jgi:hypothetical protein
MNTDPVVPRRSADALLQLGVRELAVIPSPEGALARSRNRSLALANQSGSNPSLDSL